MSHSVVKGFYQDLLRMKREGVSVILHKRPRSAPLRSFADAVMELHDAYTKEVERRCVQQQACAS